MKLFACITLGLILFAPQAFAQIEVFACEPEWQALAQTLGGKHVRTYSATTAFQDPHHIEARPSLIAKTRQADLLVCTGAELEIGWLPLLVRQSGNARIQQGKPGYFLAASQVEPIEVPATLDRSHGDIHASGNPHVHLNPYKLLTIAQALNERLQLIDPVNANHYQQNYQAFADEWQTSIEQWEQRAATLKGKKVIVYHKNWSYLLDWLDIKAIGDLEPKPGIPPNSAHLAQLLTTIRSEKPDFIIMANYQNSKSAQWLSKKAGIPILKLPFTVGGSNKSSNLQSLYEEVINALAEAG